MKEHHESAWYGECAEISDKYDDYVQIEYKCNGTGRLYDYALFPGINLIFMILIAQTLSMRLFLIEISLKSVTTKKDVLSLS